MLAADRLAVQLQANITSSAEKSASGTLVV